MALLVLLADWAGGRGVAVTALTVDHGLRPGSADEVELVAEWCSELGIPHHGLEWGGGETGKPAYRKRRARPGIAC